MATLKVHDIRIEIPNAEAAKEALTKMNALSAGVTDHRVFVGRDESGVDTWVMVPAGVAVAIQD